jgi:threonine/homoserine/homoserine lactone efflux protein
MDITLAIKGAVIGFVVAAPGGPIAVLCIHRTIGEGRLSGLATGLGAALADTVYGGLAAFGLSFVTRVLIDEQSYLRLAGGLLLCALGAATLLRRPTIREDLDDHLTLLGSFASAFALTLANPITVLAFLAIYTGFGLGHIAGHRIDGATLVAGVFLGAAAWWLLVTIGTALFRDRFTDKGLLWITRASGLAIIGFGVVGLASGIARLSGES